ncbi:Cthe_2314 family HEPN domain-containing protein [Flavobacterium sp. MAHUQ-51]|uniref:Cthe_2314 family HEPN domain-containing protein n=1 Tax=Flavobacterium sp. GCM10022190 TaxID=3252639 RepID=UPI0036213037
MNIDDLIKHNFYQQINNDVEPYIKGVGFVDMEILKEDNISDLEHYIRYTSFYAIHLYSLCRQLENAVSLLSNYKYSKKDDVGRGYHLSYNVENYFIRLDSLYDRILQVINAVFTLGFKDNEVKKFKIIPKLGKFTVLLNSLDSLSKVLYLESDTNRNIVVHRHSYLEKELSMLEMFYHPFFSNLILNKVIDEDNFKQIRKEQLAFFLKRKKKEFKEINEKCFEIIFLILTELDKEYISKKQKLNPS